MESYILYIFSKTIVLKLEHNCEIKDILSFFFLTP